MENQEQFEEWAASNFFTDGWEFAIREDGEYLHKETCLAYYAFCAGLASQQAGEVLGYVSKECIESVEFGGISGEFSIVGNPSRFFPNPVYTSPQPVVSEWIDINKQDPELGIEVTIKLVDDSILTGCLPQTDGDFYCNAMFGEFFVCASNVVAWLAAAPEPDQQ